MTLKKQEKEKMMEIKTFIFPSPNPRFSRSVKVPQNLDETNGICALLARINQELFTPDVFKGHHSKDPNGSVVWYNPVVDKDKHLNIII